MTAVRVFGLFNLLACTIKHLNQLGILDPVHILKILRK